MVDIETDIFDYIATAVEKRFPDATVSDEAILAPSRFPFVSIVEADNYIYRNTQDSSGKENHAVLMYEVNVFSNKTGYKKTECKKIFAFIDELLVGLGFRRVMKNPASLNDATVYRLAGRYECVADNNKTIYGG